MLCGQRIGIGRLARAGGALGAALLAPNGAAAHAGEGALSLLLPTAALTLAGAASVAATVVVLALLPDRLALAAYATAGRTRPPPGAQRATRCLALLVLLAAILHGIAGTADPARNAMPLLVWPVAWMGLVMLQALVFDVFAWVNPFAPLAARRARRPWRVGRWPAVALLLAFAAFLLADPAPSDPARLATVAAGYLALSAVMGQVFGPRWLAGGEVFTVLARSYARIAPFRRGRLGLWGWRAARAGPPDMALAVFMVALLASGSFDGLNETFLWLGLIGINPLEFPGRSAILWPTLAGLAGLLAGLLAAYAATLAAGLRLAGRPERLAPAFRRFAPSLLPIAAAYHAAHYLVSLLVDGQWVRAFLAAPFGFDIPVTTGFLGALAPVRAIWLTQGALVTFGHVLAVLLAHAIAVRAYGAKATRVTLPLSAFMVLYTLFGLWLLAAARGA